MDKKLILINIVVFFLGLDLLLYKHVILKKDPVLPPVVIEQPEPKPKPLPPINYDITTTIPSYLDYNQMVSQLKKWEEEAPELVKVGIYGKSTKGTDLYYLRLCNERNEEKAPSVLVTGSTHGNETLSTATQMAYIGTMLDRYGDDDKITKVVNSRDLYFVPIISPDSYPHSRYVDGVDPNRDYPTKRYPSKISVAPIKAIQDLFNDLNPRAVISGHTFGRVFLYPWGDSRQVTSNDTEYKRILREMSRLSRYGIKQACYVYGRPIYGTEMDWYYRNGAVGMVIEYGIHQRKPTNSEIKTEFDKTFEAVLYFMDEAPKVEIQLYAVIWK
jgi:hypothetical protein